MFFPLRLRHELLGIMLCHIIIHVAGATFATKEAQCPSDATPANYTTILQREAIDYEQSSKFRNKIDELHGKRYVDWEGGRIGEVVYGLRALIRPRKTASILDLGCASGLITLWAQGFASSLGSNAEVWGVELVPGWVSAAKSFANGRATFIQGDLTAINLKKTFDVVFMSDSYEHIPAYRYEALWKVLATHTHEGSKILIHSPLPSVQLRFAKHKAGGQQYFENVVSKRDLAACGKQNGFKLYQYNTHAGLGVYFSAFFVKV